jgi:cytoskeletal protein RodZ
MAYKSIGQVLKERRIEAGLNLETTEKLTNIQRTFIVALEHNDYDTLPGEFYAKAYLKQYATRLGMDPQPLLDAYDHNELIEVPDKHTGDTIELKRSELEDTNEFVGLSDDVEARLSGREKIGQSVKHYLPFVTLLSIALLILGTVAYVVIKNYDKLESKSTMVSKSKQSSETSEKSESSKSEPASTSESSSVSSSVDPLQVTSTLENGNLTVAVTGAENPAKLMLSVDPGVQAWVSVSNSDLANGTTLSDAANNQVATLTSGAPESVVRLGVVDGVTIQIGNKAIDLSQLQGQTVTNITVKVEYR